MHRFNRRLNSRSRPLEPMIGANQDIKSKKPWPRKQNHVFQLNLPNDNHQEKSLSLQRKLPKRSLSPRSKRMTASVLLKDTEIAKKWLMKTTQKKSRLSRRDSKCFVTSCMISLRLTSSSICYQGWIHMTKWTQDSIRMMDNKMEAKSKLNVRRAMSVLARNLLVRGC